MTHRQKKIISICLIVIIVLGVGIATYMIFFKNKDSSLHVTRLGGEEIVDHKASQYSKSSLDIYPYGAFEIQLIRTVNQESTIVFVGIGTYKKTKTEYTFTYTDCYYVIGTEFEQRGNFIGEANSKVYPVDKSGRIRFDFQGILYYFGR